MFTLTPKRGLYGTLFVSVSVLTILAVLVMERPSSARSADEQPPRPSPQNYDIRLDDSTATSDFIATARTRAGRTSAEVAHILDGIPQGETKLRTKIPRLTVEYNEDLRVAEVIGTSVWSKSPAFLTHLPIPGDYDGDGKYDAGVFRPSTSVWYALRSTAGIRIQQFGSSGVSG